MDGPFFVAFEELLSCLVSFSLSINLFGNFARLYSETIALLSKEFLFMLIKSLCGSKAQTLSSRAFRKKGLAFQDAHHFADRSTDAINSSGASISTILQSGVITSLLFDLLVLELVGSDCDRTFRSKKYYAARHYIFIEVDILN